MGKRGQCQHSLEHYAPMAIAGHALAVYRNVLREHRSRLGVEGNEPTVTLLLADLERAIQDRMPALTLCDGLAELGLWSHFKFRALAVFLPRK